MVYKWWPNLKFAIKGMKIAWRNEPHFRSHVLASAFLIVLSFCLNIAAIEFAIIVLSCGFVIAVEVLNTALEELCDKHTKEHDPHIARIKDLAAAAVLISSIFAAIAQAVILLPYVISYVSL
jgi:diacylglycerol kinase